MSGELAEYLAFARQDGFYTGDDPAEWARRLQAHFAAEAYRLAAPAASGTRQAAAARTPGLSDGNKGKADKSGARGHLMPRPGPGPIRISIRFLRPERQGGQDAGCRDD